MIWAISLGYCFHVNYGSDRKPNAYKQINKQVNTILNRFSVNLKSLIERQSEKNRDSTKPLVTSDLI